MSHSTSVPLSPRTGLAIAAAVTGLILAGGATLAASLGWLRAPAAQASAVSAAPAGVTASPPAVVPVAGADPSQAAPLTHVDAAGNLWAWYGSGDWVLVAPAPAAPAPVLAAGREGRTEGGERAYQRTAELSFQGTSQGSVFAGREYHDDD